MTPRLLQKIKRRKLSLLSLHEAVLVFLPASDYWTRQHLKQTGWLKNKQTVKQVNMMNVIVNKSSTISNIFDPCPNYNIVKFLMQNNLKKLMLVALFYALLYVQWMTIYCTCNTWLYFIFSFFNSYELH